MTSKIIVNNIEADSGVSTVTFGSNIQGNLIGNVTGNVNSTGVTTVSSLRIGTGASISSPATNVLALGTNNVESVRINSTGVGIGTNNPASTLDVGGEITIRRTDAGNEGGQINFARASDNAVAWNIDAYGSTSTPSLRFIDNIAAVVRMQIDGSGRVTMPYQPMMSTYQCSNLSVSGNATVTLLPSAGASYDPNNNFDESTGIYTIPVSGRYYTYYGTQGKTAANTNAGSMYYNVNNSGAAGQILYYGEAYSGSMGAAILSLSANDTIRWQIIGNNNQSYTLNGAHYGIVLIG